MTPTKYKTYQSYAQYYKARLVLRKKKAVVHLESSNDKPFWSSILKCFFHDDDFDYITHTQTSDGNMSSGCGQCLLYKDFLDASMVIAIDSDLRYLLQEEDIDAAHYILQTYTYSFENHLCFIERLNLLVENVCGLKNDLFDFKDFLLRYSKEIYPLFLMYLYDKRQPSRIMSDTAFFKTLTFPHSSEWLDASGSCVIEELHNRVEVEMNRLGSIYTDYNSEIEKERFLPLGLQEENAYLYIRGHNLYDLVVEIGECLCSLLKKREKERLMAEGQYENAIAIFSSVKTFKKELYKSGLLFSYPEINKILLDVITIWS